MTRQQLAEDGRIEIPDLVASVSATAPAARVYEALADLSTHTVWGGSMHGKKNFGLRTLDAPEGPAGVGTEFRSTGVDPMGSFSDRSVVTEATSPSVFEFVTEGHLEPKKKGKPASDTRITHRFEIAGDGSGSTVTYRGHLTRWTNAPSVLRSRAMRPFALVVMRSYAKKTLRNLTTFATEH